MFIKLEIKSKTDKAYQLLNGSWIPKSILDDRGLKHPYYQIKDWWVSKSVEKMRNEQDESIYKTFKGIEPMVVKMIMPKEIRSYWTNYWSNQGSSTPDYEPRLWGNDCFEGEMSSWF